MLASRYDNNTDHGLPKSPKKITKKPKEFWVSHLSWGKDKQYLTFLFFVNWIVQPSVFFNENCPCFGEKSQLVERKQKVASNVDPRVSRDVPRNPFSALLTFVPRPRHGDKILKFCEMLCARKRAKKHLQTGKLPQYLQSSLSSTSISSNWQTDQRNNCRWKMLLKYLQPRCCMPIWKNGSLIIEKCSSSALCFSISVPGRACASNHCHPNDPSFASWRPNQPWAKAAKNSFYHTSCEIKRYKGLT